MNKNLKSIKQEFLNYQEISKLQLRLEELAKRVTKLEQVQTYFPLEYHEINETGGVNSVTF